MTIVLESGFATAEDTAEELGVPKSRLKRLVRLVHGRVMATAESSHDKAQKNGARILTSTRKRKNARGKAKKVTR